ncbi:hypothetical protein [Falsirhodobacter sp. 20TX0035]|uniref:hypothetical protein n=1 Tax=Falsirhodobacter sp. 20TX0035 TaxID=3022019 RepID=UPI00232A8720|nr:hypothetical protein [Falsirhodobacter sp. 20TX0035]MDB6455011.1 hypothetical protein [Falsirhodobacter sp. 20TX0035]
MLDIEKLTDAMVVHTMKAIDRATAPLLARLSEMEKRLKDIPQPQDGKDGAPGTDGRDGQSVTIEDIAPLIATEVARVVAALPPAEKGQDGAKGKDGRDGASVTAEDVAPLIAAEVARTMAELPVPQNGKDGADGKDGRDGKDGLSITIEDMAPLIEEHVGKAIKGVPMPKDGRDGADGKDGANGRDGAGIADLIIDRDGALIASMTDGRMKNLGRIIGKDGADGRHGHDGKDGRDGADGASLQDFTVDINGPRPVLRCITAGKVKEIPIPGFVDRGVFKDGSGYLPGDGVTFGGSFWICQKDTNAKPGESEDWRLAVKKGRDGKDGAMVPAKLSKSGG